jgi:signal transduction histidine kinase
VSGGPFPGTPGSIPPQRESGTEIGAPPRLEDVLQVGPVEELAASLKRISGLDVMVRSNTGATLLDSSSGTLASEIAPDVTESLQQRASGTAFLVAPIEYDHDVIGRIVVGPFASLGDAEHTGLPKLTPDQARGYLEHFRLSLDLILHAAQRANFASTMHLASIEESYAELLRKNAALEEAYARLKELDHLKSSFLATVSHELRTPLTSIIGYSEMLSEGMCGALTAEQLEYVQTIRNKGDQLLSLILSLLDLSKLESGTLQMRPTAVPIEAVLQDAVSTLAPVAAKKGVRLSLASGSATPAVRADPDRLRQVFVNLVENAVKFTPAGGSVTLMARETEAPAGDGAGLVLLAPVRRELEVRVHDTGIGIPTHERTRVFDPFYQVDQSSTREQSGAGLGLAIVKRIVEGHQGRIRVEANEPNGSVFVVTLPFLGGSGVGPASVRPRAEP